MAGSSSGLLSDDAMAFLAGLAACLEQGDRRRTRGYVPRTPKSDMDGVVPGMATAGDVRRWLAAANADVLVVGHKPTRRSCCPTLARGLIVNPGALLRDRAGGAMPAPVIFDPQKGTFAQAQAAPRGTFGILELPGKHFTVHLASDGSEVPVPW